jgi:hypothetical protein
MDYLGLFCLGVFVGTIATFGMHKVESLKDWQTVLSLTLPAVLSGAAVMLVDKFKYSPAFGAYPLGLAVALSWAYVPRAVENLRSSSKCMKTVGVLHICASTVLTAAGIYLAAWPAHLQVQAEGEISAAERREELLHSYAAARAKAAAASVPAENK